MIKEIDGLQYLYTKDAKAVVRDRPFNLKGGGVMIFCFVRVTRSLVLCVCFVDCCLSFCPFSFGHCVVCSTSMYGSYWTFGIIKLSLQLTACEYLGNNTVP